MNVQTGAVGFRDHSGWAVSVVLAGNVHEPTLVDRRRLMLIPDSLPRQPFHAVADAGASREVIGAVRVAAMKTASDAIRALQASIGPTRIIVAGVGASATRLPADVAIFRSHMLLHAAEGELYRDALAEAATACGQRVRRFPWKDVLGLATQEIGPYVDGILKEMGKQAGPPWTRDEREATLGAWLALVTSSS